MAGGPSNKPVNIFRLRDLDLPANVLNWRLWFAVASFGLMGAARAFVVCDRIGRIWATRQLCLLWILGMAIFMSNGGHLAAVYAGRFVAGLGIGQTPVVGPVYIAEIAPAPIRGLCTCVFTACVYLGIVLAYFANYAAQLHLADAAHARWLVPTSLHIVFAALVFLLTFFQCESPRYLVKKNDLQNAINVMARLRHLSPGHPYVVSEIGAVVAAHEEEHQVSLGSRPPGPGGPGGPRPIALLKEMFLVPSNLYRLYLACMAQVVSQWSGAGSITLYAVDLFRLLGVAGTNESLLVTGVFGIVKLVAAIVCALFLVDVIGRKRSLLLGITLQAVAMVYVAVFLVAVPGLGTVEDYKLSPAELGPSKGAIAMIYLSGAGWALGWNSMQYLLTAELFPLRIRAASTSLAMVFHFVNQYGNSCAVPNMLQPLPDGGLSPKGTFWLFAAVTVLGGAWVCVSVPETAGRSLESMDRLFALPWYKIGLHGNEHAEHAEHALGEKQRHTGTAAAEHVEHSASQPSKRPGVPSTDVGSPGGHAGGVKQSPRYAISFCTV